jgi:hypothetical protein
VQANIFARVWILVAAGCEVQGNILSRVWILLAAGYEL